VPGGFGDGYKNINMRIAFISAMNGFPWGGSEALWSGAAHRLLEQGHRVLASVVSWPETPAPVRALEKAGATLQERIPANKWRRKIGSLLDRSGSYSNLESSWRQLMHFNPDLICVSHGLATCGIDWMSLCERDGVPYVSLAQANAEQWWPVDEHLDRVTKSYTSAAKTYFVSDANRVLFEKQIGSRLTNAEVVRNPFGVPWESELPWPDENVMRLACVARLDPVAKGQDLLFQVLAMPKWKARPISVNLFGKGPCEKGLQRLAQSEGVNDQVKFAGHVANIAEVWRDHHALVLPSRFEGLPLSIVEAMLSERPVIATDVAGNKELLQDNVTGFIAAAPTALHLDEAMERAWQRRGEWCAIGRTAGEAARAVLPKDPARAFADKLLGVAETVALAKLG